MSIQSTLAPDKATPGSRVATAFFDSRDAAEHARTDLIAAGFSPETISIAGRDSAPAEPEPILSEEGGFWHALKEFFMPDEDRYTFAEGLRRGGILLSIHTSEQEYDRAVDILDADGAVDMDERERSWLSEGWTGFPIGADPLAGNYALMGDASTAGFSASVAGEDGYEPLAPKSAAGTVEKDFGTLTATGTDEAEARADAARVGTASGESGLMNPDMRERIGSGTASMTPPTPTGPQDGAYKTNAASFDRDMADKAAAEDAALGSPTRSGAETPALASTIGSTEDETGWVPRRDTDMQRARVRGFIVEPRKDP